MATETITGAGRLWRGQDAETRLEQQQERLLRAAAAVVVRQGYAGATAEAISREAKMSKATFYSHFANKEACFLALFDLCAGAALEGLVAGARDGDSTAERQRGGLRGFLDAVASEPVMARAVLVEGLHGGPKAIERRDAVFAGFAQVMFQETQDAADRAGGRRFASIHDAVGIVGAVVELTARHLRLGEPAHIDEVAASIERLIDGALVDGAGGAD